VVESYTLANASGMSVQAIAYGAILTSIRVPDRTGASGDIVLGFDDADRYVGRHPYFGAVVGRYANRIASGRFVLDGKAFQLATNDGPNHLHGGVRGFDKAVWVGERFDRDGNAAVAFRHTSPDGDEGYPGTVAVRVSYVVTAVNELIVEYEAEADRPTPVNLTQHSYFNLSGSTVSDILQHRLTIDADRFTPIDGTKIPTGELLAVADTPFDFREPTPIGARLRAHDPQLLNGGGYDHNWVLNRSGAGLRHAARVEDPASGRTMDVSTTEPGMQFYSGNRLDGTIAGKSGRVYHRHAALCLETQHFPDSPNHPSFPSTILRPGRPLQARTVFTFGVSA